MQTIFELTCMLFDLELIKIVHKFGVHPVEVHASKNRGSQIVPSNVLVVCTRDYFIS